MLFLASVLIVAELKWEIYSQERKAERAVTATVRNLRRLEVQRSFSSEAAKATVVLPARLEVFGTNPPQFKVEAHSPWPDWMIYEYDSRTPERGVYHYLF